MNLIQNINTLWQKLSLVQRAVVTAMIMACVIAGAVLTGWAGKADMRPLYVGLSLEESAKITDKLSEKGIEFKLNSNGTSILVPQDKIHIARMELAREGLPAKDQGGYSIFENTKISASPLVQEMNHKQAIEEELAKSIQMIQGIAHSRVLIVLPEQTLFNQSAEKAKASVTVKLKPGWSLSQGNIAAITNLTSSAIESLTPDNVTIVDSQGRLLSRKDDDPLTAGANTYQDYKQRVENGLSNKALEMLEMVLGPGKATVKVSAELDMTTVTTETTEYDKKGVPTKESINSTTKTKSIPKVANNQQSNSGTPAEETSIEKQEQNETEMLVGKVVTSRVDVPGKIKTLTVAVIVDLTMPKVATPPAPVSEEGEETQTEQPQQPVANAAPEKVMTVEQVKSIIQNALGKNLLQDSDAITVVDAPFRSAFEMTPQIEVASGTNLEKYANLIKETSMPIMGLFAFLSVVVFSISGKKKTKKQKDESQEAEPVKAIEEKPIPGFLPAIEQGMSPDIAYRQYVAESLKRDPEEVKQLFAAWVGEEA